MTTFALIGSGWRAQMFLDLLDGLPDLDCCGIVVRTPRRLSRPTYDSLAACLSEQRPDFVLTATPWSVTPAMVVEAVERGLPVLAETPPAPDLQGLRSLWAAVGDSGLVQVAEQYAMMPSHAARLALIASGVIGTPTQVHVSSTQQYHAVSLIRAMVGAGRTPVTVRASRSTAPLVSPLSRHGWTDDPEPHPATTTLATLDLGDGRSGLYDFTDQQTRNQLRFRRLLVRGSHGELNGGRHGDEVVHLLDARTLTHTAIVRRQTGHDLDLNGFDTEQLTFGERVLYRNPYVGRRWMDDEIAMAALLDATTAWARGEGPPPYPLADGCHDQQVALAIEQAADQDRPVTTSREAWTAVSGS